MTERGGCEWTELTDGTEVLYRDGEDQYVRCVVSNESNAIVPVSFVGEWAEQCSCSISECTFTNYQLHRFREKIASGETFRPHPSNVFFLH